MIPSPIDDTCMICGTFACRCDEPEDEDDWTDDDDDWRGYPAWWP